MKIRCCLALFLAIISSGVLERMKNSAYILYCFLIILVNYSFVAHWVWHEDGWLRQLGFIDAAGGLVVCTYISV